MANLTQLSVMIFVLIFTSSARGAMFCKDPTADCKCSGLVPSLNKPSTTPAVNSRTRDLQNSPVDFYDHRYSPAEDADEGTISLAVMWWGTDRCNRRREPDTAFPLDTKACWYAFHSLAGREIGSKYFRPGLCASRGGTRTDWCWTYYSTLVLGNTGSGPYWRFFGEGEVEGRVVRRRRRRRVSSDGLEMGVHWGYDGVDDGDSSDVIVRNDDGHEVDDEIQESANSPAGKFMMFGHEKESSAKHDGEDYEDELQELANQHAGEVMIVAQQDEVDARLDNEYEDKLQALANEQAGTLMIVARDDNM
ncbi:hypothetical protein KC316_g6912 [Hortaea werneckii]|nr:hypothetical protein KC324_g7042 [Hortaea werneckii]KAI7584067.1 hypothetical protein KC316_g6912 [Hortaea werneckii]